MLIIGYCIFPISGIIRLCIHHNLLWYRHHQQYLGSRSNLEYLIRFSSPLFWKFCLQDVCLHVDLVCGYLKCPNSNESINCVIFLSNHNGLVITTRHFDNKIWRFFFNLALEICEVLYFKYPGSSNVHKAECVRLPLNPWCPF